HSVIWSKAMISGVHSYEDLCTTANGIVLGVAGRHIFFVFDSKKRRIIKQVNLEKKFKSSIPAAQGQRVFIKAPDDTIYLLTKRYILKVNPDNYGLTIVSKSPVKINGGGAYLNGHIYFIAKGRTHLY